MSALPPKADMDQSGCDVRYVPKGDIPASVGRYLPRLTGLRFLHDMPDSRLIEHLPQRHRLHSRNDVVERLAALLDFDLGGSVPLWGPRRAQLCRVRGWAALVGSMQWAPTKSLPDQELPRNMLMSCETSLPPP